MAAAAEFRVDSNVNPEFELLLACCGKEGGEFGVGDVLRSGVEWERLLSLVERHRVFAALFAFLQRRPDVPASIQSALQARFQRHVGRSLRFSAELSAILRNFEDHGIQVLAHKGAALGRALFGDPAMRQFGDLDFLIRAADIPRARAALQQLGYRPNLQLSIRQERGYVESGYEYVFGCDRGNHLVELQWAILPRFYSVEFDINALFSRSIEIELEGRPVRMLGKDDLMLVLCVHAAKHEWAQLSMIRDISALADFDLNWDWIAAEARRLGILRILKTSLLLGHSLLGLELPKIFCGASAMQECKQLAAEFERRLKTDADSCPESLQYFRNMLRIRERTRDRFRFMWRLAFTPSVGEWKSVEVPDRYFPIYRAVRVMRVLRRVIGSEGARRAAAV